MGKHNHCFHLIRCVCPIGVAIRTVSIVFVKGGEGLFLQVAEGDGGATGLLPGEVRVPLSQWEVPFLKR